MVFEEVETITDGVANGEGGFIFIWSSTNISSEWKENMWTD